MTNVSSEISAFAGKRIVITGGTGSFGKAVLKKLIGSEVAEIRILSRDEKKQDDLRKAMRDARIKFFLGDVRQTESLRTVMYGADLVFHAAALKQVPSCEFFPLEAVKTNTLGTAHVIAESVAAGVARVVLLSTDKAAYPINAMGMSKALAEKLVFAEAEQAAKRGTIVCATRYGNVMASRGSVIPLFVEQALAGSPITVTDPEMTRFMMTLDDAVELVFFAWKEASPGDLFVMKAPASTVGDIAFAVRESLSSKSEIRVIGTRHGEKLYESLMTREERGRSEDLGRFFRVSADRRSLDYEAFYSDGSASISKLEDYNSHNTRRLSLSETETLISQLEILKSAVRRP